MAMAAIAARAQGYASTNGSTNLYYSPGKLVVLREGDGGTARGLVASDLNGSRQNPLFVEQYDRYTVNQVYTTNTVSLEIPTNHAYTATTLCGPLFLNGNAGTEGCLSLSADDSQVAFAAYSGDIMSINNGSATAPSNLSYDRGIGVVDAFGNYTNVYAGPAWYGISTGKTNPRGVATDGAGQFWGCGNGYGSLYFDFANLTGPSTFQNVDLTSCIKVVNNEVVASVKGGDVQNSTYPAGIYTFVDFFGNPQPYPNTLSYLNLQIPATPPYTNCIGFDINPAGTVAYVADSTWGLQKYVKTGSASWTLAYNLAIPGYNFNGYTNGNGIWTNTVTGTNVGVGLFSIAVDWSGVNPVIYATTGDSLFESTPKSGTLPDFPPQNPYYGNRVISITDPYTIVTGANITNNSIIANLVVPPGFGTATGIITNIVYKSVVLSPDVRPVITSNPVSWSAAVGDSPTFSVTATGNAAYGLGYQWLLGGVPIPSANSSTLSVGPVDLTYNGNQYSVIVTNYYGAVTSSIATLTVTATATIPVLPSVQTIANYIGNTFSVTAVASGTDAKTYQWYFGGNPINNGAIGDGASYSGVTSSTLTIINATATEAGAYTLAATNVAGGVSGVVANVSIGNAAPILVVPPAANITFTGGNTTFPVQAYGTSLSYTWYSCKSATVNSAANLTLLSGSEYSGLTSATLGITGAAARDNTNYVVVVSNSGGSITSAPAPLSVVAAPAHSFVKYANVNSNYVQNFNGLPVNGGSSANTANPNAVYACTNVAGMQANTAINGNNIGLNYTYSLPNPFDFAYPALAQGFIGGLSVSSMNGWYGYCANNMEFGATSGDQSSGGIVDFGSNYLANGAALTSITNRSLGFIQTTKSGEVEVGLGLVNQTGISLNSISLKFIGELWRNNPSAQIISTGYTFDPAGLSAVFNPAGYTLTDLGLNVTFPVSVSTLTTDGTQPANQTTLGVTNLPLATAWAPNTTLWIVWQTTGAVGGAQGLAIDNVQFSAGVTPNVNLGIAVVGSNVQISWPSYVSGVLQSSPTALPAAWSNVGTAPVVVGSSNVVTLPLGANASYFRLRN